MSNWEVINKKIRECKLSNNPQEVVTGLHELFILTNDGWVAFNLAQEYEKMALSFYEKAETLLPIDKYKEKARSAIRRIQGD